MKVWLAQYDCGDYYCTGEHVAGVFTLEEDAKQAIAEIVGKHHGYNEGMGVREISINERMPVE